MKEYNDDYDPGGTTAATNIDDTDGESDVPRRRGPLIKC